MIPTLYKTFQKWAQNGSVYIISDTHFEDDDCKIMDKNWITPEEHIQRIKKYCHKNDTLIHLGDVGNPEYLSEIKAHKVLIMGNHDESATRFQKQTEIIDLDEYSDTEIKRMLKTGQIDYITHEFHSPFTRGYKSNGLFDEIYQGPLMIAEKILLSHEPIPNINWGLNIHGHDHSKHAKQDNYHLNLAANVVDFEPFNLGSEIKKGLLKNILSIHRITINEATKRKK